MSRAHLHVYDSETGVWLPMTGNGIGAALGGGGGSASHQDWSYAAASGGIADTNAVTLVAAPGAGNVNYLSSIQIANADATVATEVTVLSGATVLWRTWMPAGNPSSLTGVPTVQIDFAKPLRADTNTAITVVAVTTSAMLYINAQGHTAKDVERIYEDLGTPYTELYDALGNPISDAAGNDLIVGAA
jgi:hypothetical protein